MKKLLPAAVIAGALLLAAPAAASAASYVPSGTVSVSGSAVPGGTVTVSFSDGYFASSETARVSVSGAGAVTIGSLPAATISRTKSTSATGALTVAVKLPTQASGSYSLTATGATSGDVGTASFTVVPAAGQAAVQSAALASTGTGVSMLVVWLAVGAVVLGGGVLAGVATRRRTARV